MKLGENLGLVGTIWHTCILSDRLLFIAVFSQHPLRCLCTFFCQEFVDILKEKKPHFKIYILFYFTIYCNIEVYLVCVFKGLQFIEHPMQSKISAKHSHKLSQQSGGDVKRPEF